MKRSITDIHMHIIPGVDDGAIDFKMSLEMIEEAYKQGVRNIFCTSHNVYEKEDIERYKSKFFMLKKMSESLYHDLNLFMGCELLCAGEYMELKQTINRLTKSPMSAVAPHLQAVLRLGFHRLVQLLLFWTLYCAWQLCLWDTQISLEIYYA